MKQTSQVYFGFFLCLASNHIALAGDIQWNGFLSAIGGQALNETTLPGDAKSEFLASPPSNGIYKDYLTFEPDTIYGLQGRADVGGGLSVTAQITGAGGQNFDAEIKWAYLSYELNDTFILQAGRQRTPVFFYSDYLDVGYAYHWIRPPTEVYISSNDTYEGLKLLANTPLNDDWDAIFEVYGGKSDNFNVAVNETYDWLNMYGVVASVQNHWLQLRANYLTMNIAATGSSWNQKPQDQERGGVPLQYWGIAAHAQFEKAFLGAEITLANWDEPFRADQGQGLKKLYAWYITAGYRLGQFTPHLTYGTLQYTSEDNVLFGGFGIAPDTDVKSSSWTMGLRWDFHPSTAFKVEYLTRDDNSDKNWVDRLGKRQEVDLISAGFDVLF